MYRFFARALIASAGICIALASVRSDPTNAFQFQLVRAYICASQLGVSFGCCSSVYVWRAVLASSTLCWNCRGYVVYFWTVSAVLFCAFRFPS